MENVRKAVIRLKSTVDSAEELREYAGEYARNGDVHNIVYTDYTGNAVTKVGIQAGVSALYCI